MVFEQFYLTCLSHASYLVGSEGEAAVVDPQRDVGIYLDAAREHGLSIRYVIETHLHADFVSGHRELADATGATICVGAKAGATFPHMPVRDGDEIQLGRARLRFLETPGHTEESISVVIANEDSSEPWAVLTGDTLFIGDAGRPDLSGGKSSQELASELFDSLHEKLLTLPDSVLVYPAHGAGSLCGRQLSAERSSTIGKERVSNYALRIASRDEFVRVMTSDLPERPEYFARDVEINRTGASTLSEMPPLAALTPAKIRQLQEQGAIILDTRPATQYASGHIPGSLQIGLSGQFASWAGILIGVDTPVAILSEDQASAEEARSRLARVGIEKVEGCLDGGIAAWSEAGFEARQLPLIDALELSRQLLEDASSRPQVVDVRRPAEYRDGHLAGASLKSLDKLKSSVADLDRSRPVAVYCKSGYRSIIACTVLGQAGFEHVWNLTGGFDAWKASGLPYASETGAHA